MKQRKPWIAVGAFVPLYFATAAASSGQVFTTLVNFKAASGGYIQAPLTQGLDGNFYGAGQGAQGQGFPATVFSITPDGTVTVLGTLGKSFPNGGLVQDTDGSLYGTTAAGGSQNDGAIYQVAADGTVSYVFSFKLPGGYGPDAGLIQATNGNLYGTTAKGGDNDWGVVFSYVPGGKERKLYSFCAQPNCADGAYPLAKLIQASDGNYYGTTVGPGDGSSCELGCGTVFRITPKGLLTTLYSFCAQPNCADGLQPTAELIQATNGNLYGTTSRGGLSSPACDSGCGTMFRISLSGSFVSVYSFCSQPDCADGFEPFGGLVEGTDGNFYGTTNLGGVNGLGSLFSMTSAGTLTTLHSFCSQPRCTDGEAPYASLIQATDGDFYGTTYGAQGEVREYGTAFRLSMGLGPFVRTLQTSGKVGASVTILGNNLTGAKQVTFKGVPVDSFDVNATGSAISTSVPAGAATGVVRVTVADGTVLSSNVVFRVRQ